MKWFRIRKGVHEGCMLSSCLFSLCVQYVICNAGLDEAQTRIKISRRNINNLRYADDITLLAETEEELKSLLIKLKEESEKFGLKLNIQKKLRSWLPVPSLHGKQMGKQWKQWQTLFFRAPKSLQMVSAAMKIKDVCFLEEKLWPTYTAY